MIKNKEGMVYTTTSLGHPLQETFLEGDAYHHHEQDHKCNENSTMIHHQRDEKASLTTATKKTTTTPASCGSCTTSHDHHDDHQQTRRHDPSPSKRKVHFRVTQFSYVEPDVIVPPLPISDLFYTKRELEQINRENRAIITCLEYGGSQSTSLWATTTKNENLICSLLDDPHDYDDDDGDYCQHTHEQQGRIMMDVTDIHQQRRMQHQQRMMLQQQVESPVRGLEDKTTDGFKRRYWNQQPALRAVFREQAQQRQEGIKDPHTLAQRYALFSQDSQREARQRGKNDAAIAKSAMYLTTTIRDDKNKKNSKEQQGGTTTTKIVVNKKDHHVDDADHHHQDMEQDSCCTTTTATVSTILPPLASFSAPLANHQEGEEKNHSTTAEIIRNKKNYHEYISTGQMTSSTAALGTSSVSLREASPTLLEPSHPLTSISSLPTSRNLLVAANGSCVHQVCDHHDGLEDVLRIHVLPL